MSIKNITLAVIIFLGVISRLIDHIPNFTPILSICIFSGMMFEDNKKMFIIPLSFIFLSDLFIGTHSTMIYIYISYFFIIYIGKVINTIEGYPDANNYTLELKKSFTNIVRFSVFAKA